MVGWGIFCWMSQEPTCFVINNYKRNSLKPSEISHLKSVLTTYTTDSGVTQWEEHKLLCSRFEAFLIEVFWLLWSRLVPQKHRRCVEHDCESVYLVATHLQLFKCPYLEHLCEMFFFLSNTYAQNKSTSLMKTLLFLFFFVKHVYSTD